MMLDWSDKQKLANILHPELSTAEALDRIEEFFADHEHGAGDGSNICITLRCDGCNRDSEWSPKNLIEAAEWDDDHGWSYECPCNKEEWVEMKCGKCHSRFQIPDSLIEEVDCLNCNPNYRPTPYRR